MMKRLGLLVFLAVSTLGLTACPSKNKGQAPAPQNQITVMADGGPYEIIQNAELKPDIEHDTFKDGEVLALADNHSFVEQEHFADKNENPEAEQRTTGNAEIVEQEIFEVKIEDKKLTLNGRKGTQIEIVKRKNEFIVNPNSASESSLLVHTSVSSDKSTISLLIYSQNKKTKKFKLTRKLFTRYLTTDIKPDPSNKYEYSFGTGLKIAWTKAATVEVGLCNNSEKNLDSYARTAIEEWQKALGSRLKLKYLGELKKYPPFSDLNFRCIYFVDSYLSEPNIYLSNYATTSFLPNFENGQALDGDILIFRGEFDKNPEMKDPSTFAKTLYTTVLHEFGHFLGLGHQFNGTKSIMSYKKEAKIQKHDVQAIRALYE